MTDIFFWRSCAAAIFTNRYSRKIFDDPPTEITVTEKSHGRSTSDRVRFRNAVGFDGISKAIFELAEGYVITKLTDDTYKFTVSASSTTGSVSGGGVFVTVGPVTLEA